MQLQPQMVSFMRWSGPQYQYRPQEKKQTENKYLEMSYKTNPDTCFVQLVEIIFSDRYLYEHKQFRSLVESDRKGYVDMEKVFGEDLVVRFLEEIEDEKPQVKDALNLIKRLSTKLVCNRSQIRRKFPFVNKLKQAKPLYIEQYPQHDGNQQLQALLQKTTTIYKMKYNHAQNWAIVYAEDPDQIAKLNGHFWSIMTYLRVMTYEKAKHEFDNQFLNNHTEFMKSQGKSVFNQVNELCGMEIRRDYRGREDRFQNDDDLDDDSHDQIGDDQHLYEEMYDARRIEQRMERYHGLNPLNRQRAHLIGQNQQYNQQMRIKRQEKLKYFQPNLDLNSQLLSSMTSTLTVISPPKTQQSQLSEENQTQINNILMAFYQPKTVTSKNDNLQKKLTPMELE